MQSISNIVVSWIIIFFASSWITMLISALTIYIFIGGFDSEDFFKLWINIGCILSISFILIFTISIIFLFKINVKSNFFKLSRVVLTDYIQPVVIFIFLSTIPLILIKIKKSFLKLTPEIKKQYSIKSLISISLKNGSLKSKLSLIIGVSSLFLLEFIIFPFNFNLTTNTISLCIMILIISSLITFIIILVEILKSYCKCTKKELIQCLWGIKLVLFIILVFAFIVCFPDSAKILKYLKN